MSSESKNPLSSQEEAQPRASCGIVMPISAMESYDASHWQDVRNILEESIRSANYEPNLVSDDIDIGIIHKRIVQNLYSNPVVVCDISGKNPNVMLELGMRLAFDKPVVVVKDDTTPFSFDASPLQHLIYPRTLHYQKVQTFKSELAAKLIAAVKQDPSHRFLASFGAFKVAEIREENASAFDLILDELDAIKLALNRRDRAQSAPLMFGKQVRARNMRSRTVDGHHIIQLDIIGSDERREYGKNLLSALEGVTELRSEPSGPSIDALTVYVEEGRSIRDVADEVFRLVHLES